MLFLLLLTGCFESGSPAFSQGSAVPITGLPERFQLVAVQEDGSLSVERGKLTTIMTVQRRNGIYQVDWDGGDRPTMLLDLLIVAPFPGPNLYLAQAQVRPGTSQNVSRSVYHYAGIQVSNGHISFSTFMNASNALNMVPRPGGPIELRGDTWNFRNADDLVATARSYLDRAGNQAWVVRLRIVATPSDVSRLQREMRERNITAPPR
ncbi:hypothetical protein ACQW02_06820 [Humitalea sp. 24SJ18S-53]|uniref:hypothetical protein n=1 Tax=Humitalea sp. 24SJ18S-53 TaxID=3422307 RepID=UPI003D664EA6